MYLYANKRGEVSQLPELCNTVSGYLGARIKYFSNRLEEETCEKEEEEEAIGRKL